MRKRNQAGTSAKNTSKQRRLIMYFKFIRFLNIAVSQGNATTYVRYGGLYNVCFVENFVLSLSVKES